MRIIRIMTCLDMSPKALFLPLSLKKSEKKNLMRFWSFLIDWKLLRDRANRSSFWRSVEDPYFSFRWKIGSISTYKRIKTIFAEILWNERVWFKQLRCHNLLLIENKLKYLMLHMGTGCLYEPTLQRVFTVMGLLQAHN